MGWISVTLGVKKMDRHYKVQIIHLLCYAMCPSEGSQLLNQIRSALNHFTLKYWMLIQFLDKRIEINLCEDKWIKLKYCG